jgi:hypothetical protein
LEVSSAPVSAYVICQCCVKKAIEGSGLLQSVHDHRRQRSRTCWQ